LVKIHEVLNIHKFSLSSDLRVCSVPSPGILAVSRNDQLRGARTTQQDVLREFQVNIAAVLSIKLDKSLTKWKKPWKMKLFLCR